MLKRMHEKWSLLKVLMWYEIWKEMWRTRRNSLWNDKGKKDRKEGDREKERRGKVERIYYTIITYAILLPIHVVFYPHLRVDSQVFLTPARYATMAWWWKRENGRMLPKFAKSYKEGRIIHPSSFLNLHILWFLVRWS